MAPLEDVQVAATIAIAVAALVTGVFTGLVWWVYKQMAGSMREQTAIQKMQTVVQREQARVSARLAALEYAPQLTPGQDEDESLAWAYQLSILNNQAFQYRIRNLGKTAFGIHVGVSWASTGQGYGLAALMRTASGTTTMAPNQEVVLMPLPRPEDQPRPPGAQFAVAVIHHQDALGDLWHTTWNLNPHGGKPQATGPRFFIWNEGRWKDTPGAHEFCPLCGA
jgi:hypothetical protein